MPTPLNSIILRKIIEISQKIHPEIKDKEKRIALLTDEKASTVKNWLHKKSLPPESRRLKIADKLGVSKDYLYSEDCNPEPPMALYDEKLNAIIIPKLEECDIYSISINDTPVIASERYTLSLKDSIKDRIQHLEKTYCFEVDKITFHPYAFTGDIVVFNESYDSDNNLNLFVSKKNVEIVRISSKGDELINQFGKNIPRTNNTILLPILYIVSNLMDLKNEKTN